MLPHPHWPSRPHRPLPHTQALTAGTLSALADLVSQKLGGASPIKWRRTILLFLYGCVYSGPCAHYWQIALEKLFPNKDDPLRVLKKVVVDQLVYSPVQNMVVLTYLAKVVEGLSLDTALTKVSLQFPVVQAMGWRVRGRNWKGGEGDGY